MHVYPCVEYWYNFSSVLPTSLLHSLAFLFIVFLPIPLCNSLLFWSLLIAEMIMLHRAPGHPPARKVCVTCLEDFCCGLSCGAGWWKLKRHTKWLLSLNPTQLAPISPFSDYIVCERIHHDTFPSSAPTDRWKNTKMIWQCSAKRGQKAEKVVSWQFIDSHLWFCGKMRAEEEEGGLR